MHELGHGLGLGHGGVFQDPVNGPSNYKPNHLSVMNYTWTVPALVPTANPYAQFWTLDFSQAEWPCLDELCLNEPAGIGGRANALVPAGPPNGTFARLVREAGPVDWNLDLSANARSGQATVRHAGAALFRALGRLYTHRSIGAPQGRELDSRSHGE